MQPIFVDESGDLGFGCGTNYFILAMVVPKVGKHLSKAIKNFNAHLIRNGWNPTVEIKATNVWHAGRNPDIPATYKYKMTPEDPMEVILKAIAAIDGYIEFLAIKLDTVKAGLQTAPSGILYNYFSWLTLRGPLCYFPAVELFMDRRNPEHHNNLKFDGYLETKTSITRAEKGKLPISLCIHHYHWDSPSEFTGGQRATVEYGVRGLEAADFVCWAIKKKFENGDDRWYKLIEPKIKYKQTLF